MNDTEFNLIDEPWIRVIDKNCDIIEVSLKDAIINAHEYKALKGELPTQDVAVMRLILAVIHTVISRYDANGTNDELDNNKKAAVKRWKSWWDNGRFPEKAVSEYLDKWHERFWLFHPERPFFQVGGLTKGTKNETKKLNGEISESKNKKRFFNAYSHDLKNIISYSQAARWLLYLNGYDDVSLKSDKENKEKAGGKLPSAKRGWLGQLGLIYVVGNDLFETLMMNLVMICDNVVQNEQKPIWENDFITDAERTVKIVPTNLAELYTVQFRRVLLERNEQGVCGYLVLAGDFFENDAAYKEPMTLWKKQDEKTKEVLPRKHDPSKQMWREFSSLYTENDNNKRAGIIIWYNIISEFFDRQLRTNVVSLVYDEKQATSLPVKNIFSDSLTMHSSLISELGANWRSIIEDEIKKCEKLAGYTVYLVKHLYVASGGSNSSKDKHYNEITDTAKEQLYYRLDMPFREWLRNIEPDCEKQNILNAWQKTAKRIALRYAEELVSEQPETAIIGHTIEGKIYSSPKAFNEFRGKVKKLYEGV